MVQDILIAPGSGEPFIDFMATGVPSAIKLSIVSGVIPASGTSELSFEGTQGQLFSIADNLSSGTIFSVSDVTGLPLIEADASGDVKIAEFGRNVGVGSGVLPAYQLDVFGTGNFHQGIRFSDGTTQTTAFSTPISVANGGTNASSFADKAVLITQDSGTDTVAAAAMHANGELLIGGTSGPAVATLTAGTDISITNADGGITIAYSGSGPSPSDKKLKENIKELQNCLEKIDKLSPVSFDWNILANEEFDKQGSDIGLIAQEVEEIFPEIVGDNKGFKALDYVKLTVLLISAVKELKQQIEQLKNSQ